ncbi:MAG TPA: hypothetical protein ENG09_00160 [Candidatus Syntrophoarchaeum butanivorans]|uniref:Uncharacterized protein n=1 Tax=Candidatus Syntropharchaeum butanivorans TaxID=1839936 RepID=A0A7C1B4V8_9EURY|nr:hypothetical protein [Candidatus Syntrophoarchaeum butanivorans]
MECEFVSKRGISAKIVAKPSTVCPDIDTYLVFEAEPFGKVDTRVTGVGKSKDTPEPGIHFKAVVGGLRSVFMTLDEETAERLRAFFREVGEKAMERKEHWIEINLGPCFHSDYSCHFWRGDDRTPIEQIIEEAINNLKTCGCWKEEAIEKETPKIVREFFEERERRMREKAEKERELQEKREKALKEAKASGKEVAIACVGGYDGDEEYPGRELGWVAIWEVATPDGRIITKESPSY